MSKTVGQAMPRFWMNGETRNAPGMSVLPMPVDPDHCAAPKAGYADRRLIGVEICSRADKRRKRNATLLLPLLSWDMQ